MILKVYNFNLMITKFIIIFYHLLKVYLNNISGDGQVEWIEMESGG